MGRDYAGILGTTAMSTVLVRGLISAGGLESILIAAIGALFLFAGLGWLIGHAAARIVDESVRQRINAELDRMEQGGNASDTLLARSAKNSA